MRKLLFTLALFAASTQIASATPTRFYLFSELNYGTAYVNALIVIDPTTGAVQPGDLILSVRGFPNYYPNQNYNLTLASVTSTKATTSPVFGFIDGITDLLYTDASGTSVNVNISADSGSLIGYSGGNLCIVASASNCRLGTDLDFSYAAGPDLRNGGAPQVFTYGTLTSTPEPSGLALLGSGLFSTFALARRRSLR